MFDASRREGTRAFSIRDQNSELYLHHSRGLILRICRIACRTELLLPCPLIVTCSSLGLLGPVAEAGGNLNGHMHMRPSKHGLAKHSETGSSLHFCTYSVPASAICMYVRSSTGHTPPCPHPIARCLGRETFHVAIAESAWDRGGFYGSSVKLLQLELCTISTYPPISRRYEGQRFMHEVGVGICRIIVV